MVSQRAFEIVYAPIVKRHLDSIERKYYSNIRKAIEIQLRFEPDVETRNRKPLKWPVVFGAQWEVRSGSNNRFRIFYSVNRMSKQVNILAIGEKEGDKLLIGEEEIEL
jgi:mRNA-degrading endonuclease RelE of RelBE toxin-antitoxin system